MEFTEPILNHVEYKKLVEETVGEYRPHIQHDLIICKEDNKVVAVFNYIQYGLETMFLHHCWFVKEFQMKIKKLKYWIGFCDDAKSNGYKYIMGAIDTRNKPALIWALKTGFEITGTRQSISKDLIVEIIKEL